MKSDKIFYIENLGCAKNQVDAEVMIEALVSEGWIRSEDPAEAALIIVNTCGFIEPAKEESVDVLIAYRDAFPDAQVIAAGCLAERYPAELSESMPELDGIFGNAAVSMINDFVAKKAQSGRQLVMVPELQDVGGEPASRDDLFAINRTALLSGKSTAYVKLAEGCDNNCSFCAIPIIRGGLRSRKPESIVEEVRHLVLEGILEINLIAQDLGSYGVDIDPGGKCLLAGLLADLEAIEGDFYIRMLYIHPDNFPLEILDICADSEKILHYFDIPFQHAVPEILTAMNRKGDPEANLKLVETIRAKLPDAVIRTTFLIGFPGETPAHREMLRSFIGKLEADWAGFFVFSREEDTVAYDLESERKHNGRKKAAEKELGSFQQLQASISSRVLQRFVGSEQRLFVEEAVEQEDLYLCRAWFQAPEVDGLVVLHAEEGSLETGCFVDGELRAVNGIDMEAVLKL